MCTAFTLRAGGALYFGRNMDLTCHFGESVVVTPAAFSFPASGGESFTTRHAMIGMANVTDGCPLYAEAVSETGLCMAALNFPGNAVYLPPQRAAGRRAAPYELIPLVLGSCENLAQARALLERVELVAVPFRPHLPLAPLHFLLADSSGALVAEQTGEGMRLYPNPYGVLTNNPPFPFHTENVRQYLALSPGQPESILWDDPPLTPFSQGMGAMGLPGDFSSPSRFVKTLFCKRNSLCPGDELSCVSQVFHILDSVAMVRGSVRTAEGESDLTTYSCCVNATTGSYYYKTYDNSALTRVDLTKERRRAPGLTVFPLETGPFVRAL